MIARNEIEATEFARIISLRSIQQAAELKALMRQDYFNQLCLMRLDGGKSFLANSASLDDAAFSAWLLDNMTTPTDRQALAWVGDQGESLLHEAARHGAVNFFMLMKERLSKEGFNRLCAAQDNHGETPFMIAMRKNQSAFMQGYLENVNPSTRKSALESFVNRAKSKIETLSSQNILLWEERKAAWQALLFIMGNKLDEDKEVGQHTSTLITLLERFVKKFIILWSESGHTSRIAWIPEEYKRKLLLNTMPSVLRESFRECYDESTFHEQPEWKAVFDAMSKRVMNVIAPTLDTNHPVQGAFDRYIQFKQQRATSAASQTRLFSNSVEDAEPPHQQATKRRKM